MAPHQSLDLLGSVLVKIGSVVNDLTVTQMSGIYCSPGFQRALQCGLSPVIAEEHPFHRRMDLKVAVMLLKPQTLCTDIY